MHKGIRIYVKLMVEGEDQPTHDFTQSTIKAVQEILAAGQTAHPELKVTVRKIDEDVSETDESSG